MQNLQNTYLRNYHGFNWNYIHSKYATRMFMAYAPILQLVSFGQHSIYIQKTISELGDLETTVSPKQMVICQNCTNANSIITITNIRPQYSSTAYK